MRFEAIDYVLGSKKIPINDLSPAISTAVLEKIKLKSGIDSIRVCNDSEDAVTLAKSLIEKDENIKNLYKSDLIIVVSESNNTPIPPISSRILERLGLFDNTIVLDIDSGLHTCESLYKLLGSFHPQLFHRSHYFRHTR